MAQQTGRDVAALPVFSAIVFAYRNEATVARAIASLVGQDFDEPFEVIVATSGGDRTAELVRQNFPGVRVAESPVRLMPGGARNLGMRAARGAFIGFLEADCVARPGWISRRVATHRAGHEVVASAVAVANPHYAAARATAYLCYDNRLENAPEGPVAVPRSFGLSFSRQVLERAGPFDEALRIEEDTLMAERLREIGVGVWFAPSVCIEHVGPTRLNSLLRDQAARGRRQARIDVVTRPAGSFRARVETDTGTLALSVGARTLRRLVVRSRFLARNLRRCAPDRRELAATMPWVLLGLGANMVGWAREQYAYGRHGAFTDLDGAGPARSGLRRRTTTTGDKTLALTFDDGPSAHTSGVLDVLARYGVRATFFVLGEEVADRPEVVRAIAAGGHGLGLHGWSHVPFTELSPEVLAKDLGRTADLVYELSGVVCHDVRPPKGVYDRSVITRLDDLGFVPWLWTADARDFEAGTTPGRIARKVLLSLTPGGIVLMHDGGGDRSGTVQALPAIIEGAMSRGFRFVALHHLAEE